MPIGSDELSALHIFIILVEGDQVWHKIALGQGKNLITLCSLKARVAGWCLPTCNGQPEASQVLVALGKKNPLIKMPSPFVT